MEPAETCHAALVYIVAEFTDPCWVALQTCSSLYCLVVHLVTHTFSNFIFEQLHVARILQTQSPKIEGARIICKKRSGGREKRIGEWDTLQSEPVCFAGCSQNSNRAGESSGFRVKPYLHAHGRGAPVTFEIWFCAQLLYSAASCIWKCLLDLVGPQMAGPSCVKAKQGLPLTKLTELN